MTAADRQRSVLLVEGKDDVHAIWHLLGQRGFGYGSYGIDPPPPPLPEPKAPGQGIDDVLAGIGLTVRSGTGRSAGFVVDANDCLRDRWKAVASRLGQVGVAVPKMIPSEGFVGVSREYKARVGVWLMPDNQRSGALEDFLADLVDPDDRLLPHARQATKEARMLGAEFREPDTKKAVIHSWLAWQRVPGLPYGTALRARYFRHDTAVADSFVDWFQRLYLYEG